MRKQLIFALLLCGTINAAFALNPLARTVKLEMKSLVVRQALETIGQQANCRFSYNPDILPTNKVNLSFKGTVKAALNQILGTEFQYKERGSYIIILPKSIQKQNQKVAFEGAITDAQTGEKLSGTSVYQVNSLKATLTSSTGDFQLKSNSYGDLTFFAISKLNYRDTIIQVDSNSSTLFDIELQPLSKKGEVIENPEQIFFLVGNKVKQHFYNVQLIEKSPVQLSLVPGISTNSFFNGKAENNVSINIIGGFCQGVYGAEVGGVFNINSHNVKGAQVGGVLNKTGNNFIGAQVSGVSNWVGKDLQGAQISGVYNRSERLKGVQISGVININKDTFVGAQIAGLYNHTHHLKKGIQIGVVNNTQQLNGMQIGLINRAKKGERGVMLGLLNLTKNGLLDVRLGHSDLNPYQLQFVSGNHQLYTVISTGFSSGKNSWSYGLGLGRRKKINSKWYTQYELLAQQMQNSSGWIENAPWVHSFNFSLGFNFSPKISVVAGPVVHYAHHWITTAENTHIFNALGNNTQQKVDDTGKQKAWFGYQISLVL